MKGTKIYGSCGICMCEVEGNPKLCKACATVIAPGMVINTNTERVIESRKNPTLNCFFPIIREIADRLAYLPARLIQTARGMWVL